MIELTAAFLEAFAPCKNLPHVMYSITEHSLGD